MDLNPNPFDRGFFPDISLSGEDGLLAAGGSLETDVLLEAYSKGIFPWYSEGSPILWWSPDPRMVIFPDRFRVSKSLDRTIRNSGFDLRRDTAFNEVIGQCAKLPRAGQQGTWITGDMINAYVKLHREGYAHSFEVFREGRLAGGLYGVSLGRAFFGESMFHLERDASKVALFHLVQFAIQYDFILIDAQQSTAHLMSLGGVELPRDQFLKKLGQALAEDTMKGDWGRQG